MITYYTCWLIEQRVGDEWRVVGTAETALMPHLVVKDLNPDAEYMHPKYPRQDLYYSEKSDTLYRVTNTNHYIRTKTQAPTKNPFGNNDCPI